MKRGSLFVLASLLAGCPLGPTIVGTYDSGSGSGTDGEGGDDGLPPAGETESGGDESSTGGPISCDGVEPSTCTFCASNMDGLGCPEEGGFCSNGVDTACACQGGTWVCSDEPLVDACGPTCVEAGPCEKRACLDMLTVRFDIPAFEGDFGEVETGLYTMNVLADGVAHACEFEIEYDAFSLDYLFVNRGCDTMDYGFGPDFTELWIRERPSTIWAALEFEGANLAEGEVADIEYALAEANGPGCDGVCLRAEITIPAV